MPIISVEIMKTIDERETQKTTKEKQTNSNLKLALSIILKQRQ